MLKKQFSINKSKFDLIFKKARHSGSEDFHIRYLPNNKNYSQFAIIVSKKTAKLAVDRNYTRRVIKNLIAEKKLSIKVGYYYLITVKKNIQRKDDKQAVAKQLQLIFDRIR